MTTSATLNPTSPKPGQPSVLTCLGYGDGKSRTIAIRVDGTEIKRVVTTKASITTAIPGLPAGTHTIEANGMLGCAQVKVTVTAIVVPPVDPPATGIPAVIPGDLMTHNFATDGMGPFRNLTYPNGHEDDADPMLGFKRYGHSEDGRYLVQRFVTDAAHTSIHNGYLDQRCTPPTGVAPWLASFAGTFDEAANKFTRSFTPPFLVLAAIAFDLAGQDCEWPGEWVYGTWLNKDLEVPDWPELYNRRAHANLHGPTGKTEFANLPIPAGWHVYGQLVLPDQVAVSLDLTEVARRNWPVGTGPLGIFLDVKAGLAAPPASPKPFGMRTAWVSVAKA